MLKKSPIELTQAVLTRDPTTCWHLAADSLDLKRIHLTSSTWRSVRWDHDLVLIEPSDPLAVDTALLYLTGGDINEGDLDEARQIAEASRLPMALLFQIPVQPLFERREDDLIAYTFEQYIDTGDATWPLIFPMAKAGYEAINALQELLGIRSVVVTGASKRGWAAWMVAALADPRVIGVAPMVFDNLNFPAQMAHQVRAFGGFSERIDDYTSRDLQAKMNSERGAALTRMVDPFSYIREVRCPLLIINGSNDPYWPVDAAANYWNDLPESKRMITLPNEGHTFLDKDWMIQGLAAFSRACWRGIPLPTIDLEYPEVRAEEAVAVRLWQATSENLDFRESHWSTASLEMDQAAHNAVFGEGLFRMDEIKYHLTTPVQVLK